MGAEEYEGNVSAVAVVVLEPKIQMFKLKLNYCAS
jgi:hypothetical protein